MRELTVFNNVSLDGYFADAGDRMDWARAGSDDPEFAAFVADNASGSGTLLFGRVTYDLMASFWPSPMAAASMPAVAARMNAGRKIVVSRTMRAAAWNNTSVLTGDLCAEIRRLKGTPGESITVLGSGSIVSQLTQADLVDEYQLVVNPVILGAGKTLFAGVERAPKLELRVSRTFKNGKVLLTFARMDS